MTDPYVSIDTFSIGSEPVGESDSTPGAEPRAAADAPVLARLPWIAPPRAEPPKTHRYDAAERPLHGIHADEGEMAGGPLAGDLTMPVLAPGLAGDPTVTLRIDTVTPTSFDATTATPSPNPAPLVPSASQPAPAPSVDNVTIDDPWAAWLVEAEAAILPYSRWIVLAAVIAALGLTLVLLQTTGRPALDAGDATPQVQIGFDGPALADSSGATEATGSPLEAPAWSSPDNGLQPLADGQESTAPPLVAAGPASAPPRVATLLGDVLPSEPPVATAQRLDYPRTAIAPSEPTGGSLSR